MDVEMNMIIEYNFELMRNPKDPRRKCIPADYLAQRLWNNFIWKGYIHPDTSYVPLHSGDYAKVKVHFNKQMAVARSEGKKRPDLLKKAKKDFRRKAYLSLSKGTLDAVL